MIKLINIITQNIYCIIPEADYILKEDTSFLTKVLAQV